MYHQHSRREAPLATRNERILSFHMKIIVCVKHVPDPNLPMKVDQSTKRLVRNPSASILDPADEFGLEVALKTVEAQGGEVVAVTMGPAQAEDALRRAMAMGAERAIHIVDDTLAGSDALGTARALAAAIQSENPDLVICAVESTDAYSGMVPGALAELLGLPQVTFARTFDVSDGNVTVQRATETGYQTIQAALPALVTVTASVAEPRYPSFKGLMQAKKKPIDARSAGDLGLDPTTVGAAGAKERVLTVELLREEKQTQTITDDGGDSVEQIVAFLKKIQVA
jgi:electron transfer flavoprotein beta subunit